MDADEHDRYRELTALFVLDALAVDERASFAAHVVTCATCAAEVRALRSVADALAYAPAQTAPPASLRGRVLSAIGGRILADEQARTVVRRPRRPGAWMAAAAALALAALSGGYAVHLRGRVGVLEDQLREARLRAETGERQLAELRRASDQAQAQVVVLAAPDVARVDLAGQPEAPSAMARAFWSRSRGLVFTATELPALPAGRIYQLWVVTAQAPISAGLLRPDDTGRVNVVFQTPPDIPPPVAMAVTIEPEGGVDAPSGARYLIGTPSL